MNIIGSIVAYIIQNPSVIMNELTLLGKVIEFASQQSDAGKPVTTANILENFVEHPLSALLNELAAQPMPVAAPAPIAPIAPPAPASN